MLDASVLKALDEVWEEEAMEVDATSLRGYSCVIDNVNQKTHTRHNSKTRSNKQYNMIQGYAFKDRVDTLHLSDIQPHPDDIRKIPISNYLPTADELRVVRDEMETIFQRLLVRHLPACGDLADVLTQHITHEFSTEAAEKTPRVNK